LLLDEMDEEAARRTRSIIMFLGPLMHREDTFRLPYAGGCDLGTRTVEPHMTRCGTSASRSRRPRAATRLSRPRVRLERAIVLTERGDTVTENALMAAARYDGQTIIRNASSNYMVQDLCFYLCELGVRIEGIGTTTLMCTDLPRSTSTSPTRQ
jgi:UDP-N-acetylglucosamine 1-carboxyvinyltransferase